MDLSIIALVVHFLISIWPKTNIIYHLVDLIVLKVKATGVFLHFVYRTKISSLCILLCLPVEKMYTLVKEFKIIL